MSEVSVDWAGGGGRASQSDMLGLDASIMQNVSLFIAIANIVVNVVRIIIIFMDAYTCQTEGKRCNRKPDPFPMPYDEFYTQEWKLPGLRGRGPEVLSYSTMIYVHSRLFKAVQEDDWDTINLWLILNGGLTVLNIFPGVTFNSVFGTNYASDALIGLFVIDILEYGIIYEYQRTKTKSMYSTREPAAQVDHIYE